MDFQEQLSALIEAKTGPVNPKWKRWGICPRCMSKTEIIKAGKVLTWAEHVGHPDDGPRCPKSGKEANA